MKHIKTIAYLLFFQSFGVFAQDNNCIIRVKTQGLQADGREIQLQIGTKIDSAMIENGIAQFKTGVVSPSFGSLTVKHKDNEKGYHQYQIKYMYVQPGVIEVNIINLDSLFKSTVKGPSLTTEYEEELRYPVDRFNVETNRLRTALLAAKKAREPDTVRLKALFDANIKKCFTVPQVYIKANPDSPLSLIALSMLGIGDPAAQLNIDDIEKLFNSLSGNIKNSPDGLKYAEKLKKFKEGLR